MFSVTAAESGSFSLEFHHSNIIKLPPCLDSVLQMWGGDLTRTKYEHDGVEDGGTFSQ